MPAGDRDNGFYITCGLFVYDSLDASTSLTNSEIKVEKLTLSAEDFSDLVTSQISSAGSMDATRQALSTSVSTINYVDCELAPNCTALKRSRCIRTENTCGECFTDYFGESGQSNSACLSADIFNSYFNVPLTQLNDSSDSVNGVDVFSVGECASVADCSPFESCSLGRCVTISKLCPGQCSGNGYCSFFNIATGSQVAECAEGSVHCSAHCICESGYSGLSCGVPVEDMVAKRILREELVNTLYTVIVGEDATSSSVPSWVTSLGSITENPSELSSESLQKVVLMVEKVLEASGSINIPLKSSISLLKTLSVITELKDSIQEEGSEAVARKRRLQGETMSRVSATIDSLGVSVLNDMVSGQQPLESIQDSFRLSAVAAAIKPGHPSVFSAPRNIMEYMQRKMMPTVAISNNSTANMDMKMTLVSTETKLFAENANQFVSQNGFALSGRRLNKAANEGKPFN